jgi:hypothetical protein
MLARTRLAITRATCDVFQHRLDAPIRAIGAHAVGSEYQTACTRCDLALSGDWREMERLGAWQHYRRAF